MIDCRAAARKSSEEGCFSRLAFAEAWPDERWDPGAPTTAVYARSLNSTPQHRYWQTERALFATAILAHREPSTNLQGTHPVGNDTGESPFPPFANRCPGTSCRFLAQCLQLWQSGDATARLTGIRRYPVDQSSMRWGRGLRTGQPPVIYRRTRSVLHGSVAASACGTQPTSPPDSTTCSQSPRR
jgi:hypothetical protein